MNRCLNCENETLNPRFCSRNCSASYNNKKFPRKFQKGVCVCGKTISLTRTYCKDCFKTYRRTRHPMKEQYKYVKETRIRNKMRGVNLLGGKCSLCGYDKCIQALDFHHLNPKEKSFSISTNLNKAWKLLEIEFKKCLLLCANCHREVEAGITKLDGVAQQVRVFA